MTTERKAHITARIPPADLDALRELQRQHRRETGDDIRLADQIREAVSEYLEKRREGAENESKGSE